MAAISSPAALVCAASPRYMMGPTIPHERFRSMRALFLVIDLALELYIWILIAAAIPLPSMIFAVMACRRVRLVASGSPDVVALGIR